MTVGAFSVISSEAAAGMTPSVISSEAAAGCVVEKSHPKPAVVCDGGDFSTPTLRASGRNDIRGRFARFLVLCLCVLLACVALTGCEESDRLTEILYVQDSPIVDYDNEQKIRTFDEDGDTYDPNAPVMRLEDEGRSDHQTVRMAYSSNPETDLPTPRYVYDPEGRYDTEASEVPRAVPDEAEPPQDTPPLEAEGSSDEQDSGTQSEGNEGSDESGNNQSPSSENLTDQETNGGRTARGQAQVHGRNGDYSEIPTFNTVAAYGPTAVAVQMLCGEGPLLGTDASTLAGGFSAVFADEGARSLPAMWADGGTSAGINIDAILDANIDAVIVDSISALTPEQEAELNEWGTAVMYIPGFSSATNLLTSVSVLGEMLEGSTALASGVSPKARAADYVKYHQDLCNEIMAANGGFTTFQLKSEADGEDANEWFRIDAGQELNFSSRRMFTLLIEEWDYDARYKGASGNGSSLQSNYGVGFTHIGRGNSPVSYYMGVGGAADNSAFGGDWGKLGVVWQFDSMYVRSDASNWDYSSASPFARGIYNIDNSSFYNGSLLKTAERRWRHVKHLGEQEYPAVIVTDANMRSALLADAQSGTGIYSAYGYTTIVDGAQVTGLRLPSGNVIPSDISSAINWDDAVLVLPDGLVSQWTQGSVESVLMAPWIASQWQFQTGWHGDFEQEVRDFYSTFYRYDLSDAELADIIDGA